MPSSFKCLAIIVSYNPDIKLLAKLIKIISSQVDKVILIDNLSVTRPIDNLGNLKEKFKYIQLDNNLGLGIAHNIGIDYAEKKKYSHIIILDQDSLPAGDMVAKLYAAEQQLLKRGIQLAAVGPNFISLHDKHKTVFISQFKGKCVRVLCKQNELIETVHLISSGSLIRLSSIKRIGEMDENLFIDFVDIDWGLRAKALGYLCYGVCSAVMHHQLGEHSYYIKMLNRRIVLHSSLRYYYQFRNAMILYKRSHVSWSWIVYHFPRHILIKFFILLLFIPSKYDNIRMVLLGLWHGLINKVGKLS